MAWPPATLRAHVRSALPWLFSGAGAFPLAALLHEMGHLLGVWAGGIRGGKLHYASVSFPNSAEFWKRVMTGDLTGASGLHPLTAGAMATAGGLLMTYVLVALCSVLAMERRLQPLAIALGLISNTRFVFLTATLVVSLTAGRPVGETDEAKLAMVSGLPLWVVAMPGLLCLIGGTWVMVRSLSRGQRARPLLALTAGAVLSGVTYASVLGPWLLP